MLVNSPSLDGSLYAIASMEPVRLRPTAKSMARAIGPVARTIVAAEDILGGTTPRRAWNDSIYQDHTRVRSFKLSENGPIDVRTLDPMDKFRSMVHGVSYGAKGNNADGITKVGEKLREWGLDELPQLKVLNIVGLRPFKVEDFPHIFQATGTTVPQDIAEAWAHLYSIAPLGIIDPNSRSRKARSSVIEWGERILQDTAYSLNALSVGELPTAVAMTGVDSMLGHGKKGALAARAVGFALHSDLSLPDAHRMMDTYVDLNVDQVTTLWESTQLAS